MYQVTSHNIRFVEDTKNFMLVIIDCFFNKRRRYYIYVFEFFFGQLQENHILWIVNVQLPFGLMFLYLLIR